MNTLEHIRAGLRDGLSSRVLVPLYQLQRRIRPSTREAIRFFHEGMRFRNAAHGWTETEKEQWTLARLRQVVRHANQHTTYYRELFQRSGFDPAQDFGFEDYAQLPVLEREDVQQSGPNLVSTDIPPQQLRKDATGGSSGKPVEIWLGPEERGWRESGIDWFMLRIGVPRGSRVAYLWGHNLDPVASDRFSDRMRDFVQNATWLDCFRLSAAELERYHSLLTKRPPKCIVAYAKALADLAMVIREKDERPNYPTCCLVTGAEKLLPHHRQVVEQVFNCRVHERYGSRDVGLIGFQVSAAAGGEFEVDWANVMVEAEHEGPESSILITKLHGDGMPMLRYRLGDVGRFPVGAQPGHPNFVLHEVLGRETDRIFLPHGGWIDGIEFPHLMKDHPVLDFQVVQRPDLSLVVEYVPSGSFTEDNYRRILETLRVNVTGVGITLREVHEIPRAASNKWRPVRTEAVQPAPISGNDRERP